MAITVKLFRSCQMKNWEQKKNYAILTTGLFWILRARFAYFKVFRVSSALMSAGLMQAEIEILFNNN